MNDVVRVGDVFRGVVKSYGRNGDGVVVHSGIVVFVPKVQMGDEVDVRVVRVVRNCAFGEVV